MTDSVVTASVTLDLVLLGSRLGFGPLELALSAVVVSAWLVFGAWLWRALRPGRRGLSVLLYVTALSGLLAGALAQEALLFYAGIAVAGYATVAALLLVHGPGHAGTAAAQVALLVLGDLILFELLVHLYTEARTAEFKALRAVYRVEAEGLSFVGMLLAAAGGCRVAVLLLLVPLPGSLRPWHPGAAPGLFCTVLIAGALSAVRLIDPTLTTSGIWYTLLVMLGAAPVLYLLAVTCVLGKARIDGALRRLSSAASRGASLGAAGLDRIGNLCRRMAPRLQALERGLLSWPVAVVAATVFAVLLALAFFSGVLPAHSV
ncbi:MAG: hypothetical protein KDI01_06000 [Halioglobus sp.]|nr:hypothetical protein [Halioglobus sp.]